MENLIYNELLRRGYSVDVGVVTDRTKGFFKKIIARMDIPHNFYDENGIFHCSLIDLLLGRIDLF